MNRFGNPYWNDDRDYDPYWDPRDDPWNDRAYFRNPRFDPRNFWGPDRRPRYPRRYRPDMWPAPYDMFDYFNNNVPWGDFNYSAPTYNFSVYNNPSNYNILLDAMRDMSMNCMTVPRCHNMLQNMMPSMPLIQQVPVPMPVAVNGYTPALARINQQYHRSHGGRHPNGQRGMGFHAGLNGGFGFNY